MSGPDTSRRAFLDALVRAGLAGGLMSVGVLLAWRRWRKGACANTRACRGCPLVPACPMFHKKNGKPS